MLFGYADKGKIPEVIRAYDANGLRKASDEEKERFKKLRPPEVVRGKSGNLGRHDIDLRENSGNPLVVTVLARFGIKFTRQREIRLEGRLVRRTENRVVRTFLPHGVAWDPELKLFRWAEWDSEGKEHAYYMDEEGHYREWFQGTYLTKIPRWKGGERRGGVDGY